MEVKVVYVYGAQECDVLKMTGVVHQSKNKIIKLNNIN